MSNNKTGMYCLPRPSSRGSTISSVRVGCTCPLAINDNGRGGNSSVARSKTITRQMSNDHQVHRCCTSSHRDSGPQTALTTASHVTSSFPTLPSRPAQSVSNGVPTTTCCSSRPNTAIFQPVSRSGCSREYALFHFEQLLVPTIRRLASGGTVIAPLVGGTCTNEDPVAYGKRRIR